MSTEKASDFPSQNISCAEQLIDKGPYINDVTSISDNVFFQSKKQNLRISLPNQINIYKHQIRFNYLISRSLSKR